MKLGRVAFVTAAVAALVVPASGAFAGLLQTDSNKLVFGSNNYYSTSGPNVINAMVESAVYQPAGFQATFGFNPASDSDDYIYVYQIFNTGTTPLATNKGTSFLSVGMNTGMQPYNIGTTNDGDATLVAPNTSVITTSTSTSAKWSYTASPFLAVGKVSEFLYFVSPFQDGTHSASLTPSGMVGVNGVLPAPIPEPGTAIFATGIGLAAMSIRMRRQRGL